MQTDSILDSKILDSDAPITKPEKVFIKSALTEAKAEIITETKVATEEKAIADKNQTLATQAKVFWVLLIVGIVGLIAVGVMKILRWL